MNRRFITFLFAIAILTVSSCNRLDSSGGEEQLPTQLITNPGTSSGKGISSMAEISFKKTEHDFGIVKEGTKVFWNFRFKNTGDKDLIINRVKADCGCTVPEYPTTPIARGEEGKIKVTFDTKGRSGIQIKQVSVLSNSKRPTTVLTINAVVEK